MAEDREPPENISGGADGGGVPVTLETTADTRAAAIVAQLGEHYWEKTYGGQPAFVCLVRTILSQNTSDVASQPAHDALLETMGSDPETLRASLARADRDAIAEVIRPAGLYNQKAATLQSVARWVGEAYDSAGTFDEYVQTAPASTVRETLLSVSGIGPKTADCVLLFAGGREGVFPVDTHVHRLYRRLGIAPADADHETVRSILEDAVPPEACGFGHTASIQFGREYCRARQPACLDGASACPLAEWCDQVGIDPERGTVNDPAATLE